MERRIPDKTADEAAYWDARLRSPQCTDDDRASFAAWRNVHPDNRVAFETIQVIVAAFRDNEGRADIRALRDAAVESTKERAWSKVLPRAAVAVLVLTAVAAAWMTLPDDSRRAPLRSLAAVADQIAELALVHANTYETGVGQRSTVTLQDGSVVEMNSKTRMRVAFSDAARNVELLDGQAFFHVARNPRRPFIVRAADRDITAVGTAFDVRLDTRSVRVTLLEGKVRVTKESYVEQSQQRAGNATPASSAGKNDDLYLHPGQQFVAPLSIAAERTVRSIDIAKATGWRDGRIFLEDLTLADAVAEMNKYSPVQVRIDDAVLLSIRINGMFRAGDQQAFVSALRGYFPIASQQVSDTEIVLTQRAP